MGAEGYLVSPAVFKTVEGGDPALVSSILTCPRQRGRANGAAPFNYPPFFPHNRDNGSAQLGRPVVPVCV